MHHLLLKNLHKDIVFSRNKNYCAGFDKQNHKFTLYFLGEKIYEYDFPLKIVNITFSYACNSLVINSKCFVFIFNIFNKKIEFTHEEKKEIEIAYLTRNGQVLIKNKNELIVIESNKFRRSYDCIELTTYSNKFLVINKSGVYFMNSEFILVKIEKINPNVENVTVFRNKIYYKDGQYIKGKDLWFFCGNIKDFSLTKSFLITFDGKKLIAYSKFEKIKFYEQICEKYMVFSHDHIIICMEDGIYIVDLKEEYKRSISSTKIIEEYNFLDVASDY